MVKTHPSSAQLLKSRFFRLLKSTLLNPTELRIGLYSSHDNRRAGVLALLAAQA